MAGRLAERDVKKERERGLTDEEVRSSRATHGSNRLTKKKSKPFWRQFLSNLNDPVIRILLAALAVNLVLLFHNADWVETAGIGLAVFLATLISTLSERSSERAFARLSEVEDRATCRVRRSVGVLEILISEVVCGDIVLLSAGERIPADGVLRHGAAKVDQSAMTGESREVEKCAWDGAWREGDAKMTPSAPYAMYRGCNLTAGGGEMTVTAVGDKTFLGQISREVQLEQRDSPLKLRLGKLAKQISILGYIAAVLVALSYLFHVFLLDSGMRGDIIRLKLTDLNYVLTSLFHAFTLGLTVIVVAVPEGLPMMIAVVLSANVRKMVRDQVLVRKPVGIEAAGSMNLLFTDKTGTLTEGKMSVVSLLFAGGESFSDLSVLRRRCGPAVPTLLALGLRGGGATLDAENRPVGGSATERALLGFAAGEAVPSGGMLTSTLPFDSARKLSAVSWRTDGKAVTVLLGAPERILPFVHGAMTPDGGIEPRFSRRSVEAELKRMNAGSSRALAVAVSTDGTPAPLLADGVRGNFLLVGILELSDPIRSDAPQAVRDLHGAGIQVVMVTGDSRETAQAIAMRCGILGGTYDTVLTADEMAGMSDLRLKELLPRLAVVARALPTDKSRLVRLAQESGRVTGMTGDGINDAPALRRADVGFAMGSGTQVAKDAGDIVILDNRLSSIVRAVLYGRTVFKSIRKFITLQLTMNFSAVGVTMICPFLGIDSPVTVVQMLWINLIMDTLGGLAFAGEPPLQAYMREPPKLREESILNRYMVNEIALLGGATVAVCLLFLKHPLIVSQFRATDGNLCLLTAFFALFIFSSVFNCFNARTDRLGLFAGLGKNPVFLGIMSAVLAIQLLFVYLGGAVLRTMPLTPRELLITMLISLSVFPLEFLRKLLWRFLHGKNGY